jgi:predicted Abi (CAAX) family protease
MWLALGRVARAFSTLPGRQDWIEAGVMLAAFALVALVIGLPTGRLTLGLASIPLSQIPAFLLVAFLAPSLVEEIVFRVLLIPHPKEEVALVWRVGWAALALVLFVVYHPINGFLFLGGAEPMLYDATFLGLAALLGLVCTISYMRSGSIWPAILMHWISVVAWKLLLGGRLIMFAQD